MASATTKSLEATALFSSSFQLSSDEKSFFLLAAIACLGTSAFAQKDTKELGVGLVFGTQVESAGLNVRGQYFVTDNVRLEGSVNYFFKHSGVSMWDLSANGAYVFRINEQVPCLPHVGFHFHQLVGGIQHPEGEL